MNKKTFLKLYGNKRTNFNLLPKIEVECIDCKCNGGYRLIIEDYSPIIRVNKLDYSNEDNWYTEGNATLNYNNNKISLDYNFTHKVSEEQLLDIFTDDLYFNNDIENIIDKEYINKYLKNIQEVSNGKSNI